MTKEDIKMGENSSFVWLIFCVGGGVPLLIFFNIVMVILYYFHRKNVINDMDVVYEDIHKIFLKNPASSILLSISGTSCVIRQKFIVPKYFCSLK